MILIKLIQYAKANGGIEQIIQIWHYANYYKQDPNSNDYNDLDENAEGQSAQEEAGVTVRILLYKCLSYGGFKYRKSGLFLPI